MKKYQPPPLQPPTFHALKRSLLFNLMGMGNQALTPIILHVHAPRKKPLSVQRSSSRLYFWFMRLPRLFIPQYSRDRASRLAAPFRCDFTTMWKQLFCRYLKLMKYQLFLRSSWRLFSWSSVSSAVRCSQS